MWPYILHSAHIRQQTCKWFPPLLSALEIYIWYITLPHYCNVVFYVRKLFTFTFLWLCVYNLFEIFFYHSKLFYCRRVHTLRGSHTGGNDTPFKWRFERQRQRQRCGGWGGGEHQCSWTWETAVAATHTGRRGGDRCRHCNVNYRRGYCGRLQASTATTWTAGCAQKYAVSGYVVCR